jgi:formamidopyrimidine-DNA glycosylase
MPELPEVETTRIGIAPYVLGETVGDVIIRDGRLRWPVPGQFRKTFTGATIRKLSRRGKYLLFHTDRGCMILHLGMSGSLRILTFDTPAEKHDHVDVVFASGSRLRFRDPRRFGCILWTTEDPALHPLLSGLGPEPLDNELNGDYLFRKSRNRVQSVKTFIMDSRIVVGVGNIYANESLFASGIHPKRKAGRITKERYEKLSASIKKVLKQALGKGGTTLRDFVNGQGEPGYFRHELQVYDRANEPCVKCRSPVKVSRLGQRSTFYCSHCQH